MAGKVTQTLALVWERLQNDSSKVEISTEVTKWLVLPIEILKTAMKMLATNTAVLKWKVFRTG